jgi:hypothetical protein
MDGEQQAPMKCEKCGQGGMDGKCCGKGMWHGKWHHRPHGGKGCMGGLWFVGWLFTIGFLQLTFWKGVLAIVIWPYYIGTFLR